MPKLFVGNSFRKAADRLPGLEQILWGIEALLISIAMAISRLVPPDRASVAGRHLFRAIGPLLDKTRKLRLNLRLAFPEKSDAEIETLVRENWGNIGAVLAEYPHLRHRRNISRSSNWAKAGCSASRGSRRSLSPHISPTGNYRHWRVSCRAWN